MPPIIACRYIYSPSSVVERPSIDSPLVVGSEIDYTPGVWDGEESVSAQAWRSLTEFGEYTPVGSAWDSITGTPYTPVSLDYDYYIKIIETAFPGRATSETATVAKVTLPPITFEITTVAPGQTYIIRFLDVSASVNVNWGDGNNNNYTGVGQRSHVYAAAGTYTITIDKPLLVTKLAMRDTKTTALTGEAISSFRNLTSLELNGQPIVWTVSASEPMPTQLTELYFYTLSGLNWTVSASNPIPPNVLYLDLYTIPNLTWWINSITPLPSGLLGLGLYDSPNITWTVTSVAPIPVGLTALYLDTLTNFTWTVGASAPIPDTLPYISLYTLSGLTWEIGTDAQLPTALTYLDLTAVPGVTIDSSIVFSAGLTDVYINNNLVEAEVDLVLSKLYDAFPTRTGSNGTIVVAGTNAAPSGILQAACPPTTGKEYAYELKNDSCVVSANNWATVTTN